MRHGEPHSGFDLYRESGKGRPVYAPYDQVLASMGECSDAD